MFYKSVFLYFSNKVKHLNNIIIIIIIIIIIVVVIIIIIIIIIISPRPGNTGLMSSKA